MSKHYLTPPELAERWAIPVGTLGNWRSAGTGPTFFKLGSSVRYAISDVERYETAHAITPRHDESARARRRTGS